jgi:hypothetical protein
VKLRFLGYPNKPTWTYSVAHVGWPGPVSAGQVFEVPDALGRHVRDNAPALFEVVEEPDGVSVHVAFEAPPADKAMPSPKAKRARIKE